MMAGTSKPLFDQKVRSSALVVASRTRPGTSPKVVPLSFFLLDTPEFDRPGPVVHDRSAGRR